MKKQFSLIITIVFLFSFSVSVLFAQELESVIKVGMAWKDAEEMLIERGAQETALSVSSLEDNSTKLAAYSIPDGRIFWIDYEEVGDGKNQIVSLRVCDSVKHPKCWVGEWEDVNEISLSAIKQREGAPTVFQNHTVERVILGKYRC